jgi:division protein CdvB (Snf7/Vps24/ESCRT-III family)
VRQEDIIMPFNRKDWSEPQSESMTNKFLDKLKPQDALKPRIEEAQSKLQMQLSKLEKISAKLREKDQVIFKRVVHSLQNHDSHYAKLLSGELSQVRKMNKMVDSAKLALEQIQLRLHTVTEFGDVAATLGPAMAAMKGIQAGLSSMMPQADQSFGQISDLIGGIMSESGQIPNAELGGVPELKEESMKIIEEASALLEENTKSKFPDLSFLMMIWLNLLTKKHSLFHTNPEEFQSYLPIFYLIFAHSGAIANY